MITIPIEQWDGEKFTEVNRTFETESDFGINEANLDGELCRMGQLLLQYGDTWTDLTAQAARHQEALENYSARLALQLRDSLEKATEGKIKESLTADEGHQRLVAIVHRSKAFEKKMEILYKSLLRKSDCLNALTYKAGKEIQRY